MRTYLPLAALAAAALASTPALAHPALVSSQPAANSQVARPSVVTLTFSERLVPQFSGFDIVMTGMPGMSDHPPMKIPGVRPQVGSDGKTLAVRLARPLGPGAYEVSWRAVAADTHRISGKFSFTVK